MPTTKRNFRVSGTVEMNFDTFVTAEDEDEAWEKAEDLAKEGGLEMQFTEEVDRGEIHHVEEIK